MTPEEHIRAERSRWWYREWIAAWSAIGWHAAADLRT